jgi:Lrp/AsnC family transcriptional regulator for asnA, asnC and gidA
LGYEVDSTDRRIIALLQSDGRMSNVDIARSVGVAEATVRKRVDRLLKEGVIRVVAVPAVDRLGLEVETIIMLRVDLSQVQQIGEQLAAMNEVRSAKYATGEYDIVLEAVFPSDAQLLDFLTRRMARIRGIYATATSHVLKSIKEGCDWLLPREGPPLILVVDDDPDFVEATRMVLESADYQVTSAANGDQALRAMYRDRPDLVILDVMMNGILDGVDASFRMKAKRGVSKTPILMVSSIANSDYAAMFPTDEYVPVENFLSKPVGPDQLLAEVKRLLL